MFAIEEREQMDHQDNSGNPCPSTPRIERKRGRRDRTLSENFSEFGSPLNSLRSPLRHELTELSYSEGKLLHRDRRQSRLENMPFRQKINHSNQQLFGQNLCEENLLKKQANKIRNEEFSQDGKHRSPQTVAGATDWGSIIEEEERNLAHESSFRKRLELGKQQLPDDKGSDELKDEDCMEYPNAVETDQMVLERRQKQITYGINTPEYKSYRKQVPLHRRTKFHPWTPDKRLKYSRRGWDTAIRIWRKQLHIWDPKPMNAKLMRQNPLDEMEDKTIVVTAEEESSFGLKENA